MREFIQLSPTMRRMSVFSLGLLAALLGLADADGSYLILAPKQFRHGLYDVTLTGFEDLRPVNLDVSIVAENGGFRGRPRGTTTPTPVIIIASTSVLLEPKKEKKISLEIPPTFNVDSSKAYKLHVTSEDGTIEDKKDLVFSSKSVSIFVQTDKSKYKPGQLVKFRILVIGPNLKQKDVDMEIMIKDAKNNILTEDKLTPKTPGYHSGELQLTTEPAMGTWSIQVSAAGEDVTQTFEVAEYVLPKFAVSVKTPDFYHFSMPSLVAKVIAEYNYGEPVAGKVKVDVTFKRSRYSYGNQLNTVQTMADKLDADGERVFVLEKDAIVAAMCDANRACSRDRNNTITNLPSGAEIHFNVSVTEGLTGISVREDDESVPVKRVMYTISVKNPSTFKAGLPYNFTVHLTDPSGKPPTGLLDRTGALRELEVRANLSLSYVRTEQDGPDMKTTRGAQMLQEKSMFDEEGVATFSVNIPDRFQDMTIRAQFEDLTYSASAKVVKTRDDMLLQASLAQSGPVKDSVTINVQSNQEFDEIVYIVQSKGRLVSVEHKKFSTMATSHEFTYPVQSNLLAPMAHMLVMTFSHKDDDSVSELVADLIQFKVDGVFENEVTVAFSKGEALPGQDVQLKAQADPDSLLAFLVVDLATLEDGGDNDITTDEVEEEVSKYGGLSGGGGNPYCRGCPIARRRRSSPGWWYVPFSADDASELLDKANVIAITNFYVHKEQQEPFYPVAMPGMMGPQMDRGQAGMHGFAGRDGERGEAAARGQAGPAGPAGPAGAPAPAAAAPRSRFPETWLWSDVSTRSDGKATIDAKAPDSITTWVATAFALNEKTGLGLTEQPAELVVKKLMFVSLDLPYSMKQGEEVYLKVLIFNYMPYVQNVSVTLRRSDHFLAKGSADAGFLADDVIDTVQVPSRAGKALGFFIKPVHPMPMTIRVEARGSGGAVDIIERVILVEPEGIEKTKTRAFTIELEKGATFQKRIAISYPDEFVPGSAYIRVVANGDLMGPSIEGVSSLLRMPSGCGEQNMIGFTPNIYVMKYLDAIQQLTDKDESKAKGFMKIGYQRELNYMHRDYSFSAFGSSDSSGSLWLTSFVLRSFEMASKFIYVDPKIKQGSICWIYNQRQTNGSFGEPGKVYHTRMQGGAAKGIALSAYVLLSLLETKSQWNQGNCRVDMEPVVAKSVEMLEKQLKKSPNTYTTAIIAYTLQLAGSAKKDEAFEALWDLKKTDKAGNLYWSDKDEDDEDDDMPIWRRRGVRSNAVEMTAYALLTVVQRINAGQLEIADGIPPMKWLALNRNPNGGWASTQDTVVALQAMSEFAAMVNSPTTNVEVTVKAADGFKHDFRPITIDNTRLLQRVEVPTTTDHVIVEAKGEGMGLVQVYVKYHVLKEPRSPGITLNVVSDYDAETRQAVVTTCASWDREEESGMVLFELGKLTGQEPRMDRLNKYRADGKVNRIENEARKVVLYLDRLTKEEQCFTMETEATAEVMDLKPAVTSVFSYYQSDISEWTSYRPQALAQTGNETRPGEPCMDMSDDCPARAEQGMCATNKMYMEQACPLSCKFCGTDVPVEPAEDKCFDKHASCAEWARLAECVVNPQWMEPNCRLSCGLCTPVVFVPVEPITSSPPGGASGLQALSAASLLALALLIRGLLQ